MHARHANFGDQDLPLVPDNLDGTEGALLETLIPHEREIGMDHKMPSRHMAALVPSRHMAALSYSSAWSS